MPAGHTPLTEELDYHLITDGGLVLRLFRNTHNTIDPGWKLRRPDKDVTVAISLHKLRSRVFIDSDGAGYITAPYEQAGIGPLSLEATASLAHHIFGGRDYHPASEVHLQLLDFVSTLRDLSAAQRRWEDALPATGLFESRELTASELAIFADITALREELQSRFDLSDDQILLAVRLFRQGYHARTIWESITVVLDR